MRTFVLTNEPNRFQDLCSFETGITDFHKKQGPTKVSKRNYENFNNSVFKEHLKLNLGKFNISDFSLEGFQGSFLPVLEKVCKSQSSFIYDSRTSWLNDS